MFSNKHTSLYFQFNSLYLKSKIKQLKNVLTSYSTLKKEEESIFPT